MIAATELRIGNKFNGAGMVQTVKEILDYGPTGSIQKKDGQSIEVTDHYSHLILVNENGNQYKPIEMMPIPLTAEVLEKCGFERHQNSNEYWNHWRHSENAWGVSQWLLDKKVAGFEEKGVCYWSDQFIPVKTVHHLQNLFHALYQEELPIKL